MGEMPNLQLLNDYVLIEVDPEVPYHTYEGCAHIVVPQRFAHGPKDRPVLGTVLDKGPTCQVADLQIGQRVIIEKWRGAYVTRERDRLVVREPDILAVLA